MMYIHDDKYFLNTYWRLTEPTKWFSELTNNQAPSSCSTQLSTKFQLLIKNKIPSKMFNKFLA